jgi:hypothetical protein
VLPGSAAGASLEAAIPLANLRRARARCALAAALAAALLPAPPARADVYRWTDSEGVTHYVPDLESVPREYRGSAQRVKSQAPPARGPLPALGVERAPGPDAAGFEEPGLGERSKEPSRSETAPDDAGGQPPAAPDDTDPRELEIAELERELAARREELKTLISQSSFDSSQIATDPRLKELAELVPRLQSELDVLRGELGRP